MSKFKGKVGVGAIGFVVLLTVVLYLLVILPWSKQVKEAALADVARGAQLINRSIDRQAHALVTITKEAAASKAFVDAIQQEAGDAQRKAVFGAISDFDEELKGRRRKADFFGVVDASGRVIARDLNIKDMFGEKIAAVCVEQALQGRAVSDIWLMKNRLVRAAAAPIFVAGVVKGAVVVSFDITDAEALSEQKLFNSHVVYFVDGAARASSFPKAGARVKAINSELIGASGKAVAAAKAGKIGDVFSAKVDGADYRGVAGPLPAPVILQGAVVQTAAKVDKTTVATSHVAGFIALVDVTERMAGVNSSRYILVGFMLIFALFVTAMMWVVAKHFVDAQDQLELGVSEVISGNTEYTFEVLQEFEGLANALNVMLARLLGRPEPGEDDEGDQSWRSDVITIGEFDGATDPQLGSEPEEAYYKRLHSEYLQARQTAGLSVDGLSAGSFTQKVKANEAMLRAKHQAAGFRFKVVSTGGKVSLQPYAIA